MTEEKVKKPVSRRSTIAIAATTAAVISAAIPLTTRWEGTDLVAKRDPIGTGHPLTYCHGQTTEFGKVKAGQRFTPAQCDALLAKSLPTYLAPLQACISRPVPIKVMGALLDAAYNTGSSAVCKSSMVAAINKGDLTVGCNAFHGWYVRASGRVVRGLINRRADETKFCLQGVEEGLPPAVVRPWWQRLAQRLTFWRAHA